MTEFADIPLSEIRTDGGTQPRAALDYMAIAEYAEEYAGTLDMMPAVTVFYDGSAYWLADGFHRYGAAEKAGKNDIHAEILQGTRRDAVLYSCGANADHGLRRTDADKRRAVLTLLHDAEWSKWSDREIARKCKVGHQMVAPLRADLTGRATSERAYKTRHGTTAKMKTAGINAERRQREPKPVRDRPHQQAAAPVQHVEPSEFQGEHEKTPSGLWRSHAREAMRTIDDLLIGAPELADRAWLYARLRGRWDAPPHNEDGEILEPEDTKSTQRATTRLDASHLDAAQRGESEEGQDEPGTASVASSSLSNSVTIDKDTVVTVDAGDMPPQESVIARARAANARAAAKIIEEPNSSGCQDAVGAGQLSTPSGVEHGQAAPTMRRFLDPITGEAVDMMVKDGEIPPGLLAVTLRTFPNPGDPLPGQGLDVAPRLTSGPDPSPDPAPKAPVEGAAAASVSGQGAPAAPSNLTETASSPAVVSSEQLWANLKMPDFLKRSV